MADDVDEASDKTVKTIEHETSAAKEASDEKSKAS
jgi:hypothetical protein